uniref:HAT C-terminal dimerisation domain-containing protein n=1 Tax=Cyprinodon variegatus TaxID=28743 RepID=A0A3Q2D4V7_CYPVA
MLFCTVVKILVSFFRCELLLARSVAREFKNRHPWLEWRERKLGYTVCSTIKSTGVLPEKRVSISEEWLSFKIQSSGSIENREAALSSLRWHEMSRAHEVAQELKLKYGQDLLGHMARSLSDTVLKKNGVHMGTSLHSRYSSTKIVEHIAKELQTRIVNSIVSSSSKLSVLIDEATSATKLVEKALLNCLETAGFSDEWIKKNWIAFVSDGASFMIGRKSGVATRLTAKYPNLFTWHCMNHRLELAVADTVDEVASVNHFKTFMEKIYNLYSQSSKNSRELLEVAQEVVSHVQQIGRVLNTRWVASSFRTIKAVWRSYGALNKHFENRQTYRGIARHLQSKEFLSYLGLMYDALSELSSLSQQLQAQSVTLLKRFNICENQAVNGMRDLVEDQSREPENLKPLITCMQTIPCSTAECERWFSLMNNICTDKRSSLLLSNISELMMISINGPPVNLLEPRKYVTTWLRNHRSATETRSQVKNKEPQNKQLWNIL